MVLHTKYEGEMNTGGEMSQIEKKDENGYIILPCGGRGVSEGEIGVRCWTCMAIYGSIACNKECIEAGRKQPEAK